MDIPVEMLMDYEDGKLDFDETITMFQGLIDSGLVWSLQGSYGRAAAALIKAGECQEV